LTEYEFEFAIKETTVSDKALYELKHEVFKEGALDAREKELIAVVISSLLRCEECLEFLSDLTKEAEATDEDIQEALSVVMYLVDLSTMIVTQDR